MPHRRSPKDRFWEKVDKTDYCWLWTGAKNPAGYGMFSKGGREGAILAHRFAWTLETGEIPQLHVLHKCDTPACVNFQHLFLGTDLDNNRDKVQKGRHAKVYTGLRPTNGHYRIRNDGTRRIDEIRAEKLNGVNRDN